MIILGLTGSIAMGKSTTAKLFAEEGIPVVDSDALVHELYRNEAIPLIKRHFPAAIVEGAIDRQKLGKIVLADATALKLLEGLIHPLVQQKQKQALEKAKAEGHKTAILDIPLLFETNAEGRVDQIIVVTTTPEIQKARALARDGMTEQKLNHILARQLPDLEKRARADHIIDTSKSIDDARNQVRAIIHKISNITPPEI